MQSSHIGLRRVLTVALQQQILAVNTIVFLPSSRCEESGFEAQEEEKEGVTARDSALYACLPSILINGGKRGGGEEEARISQLTPRNFERAISADEARGSMFEWFCYNYSPLRSVLQSLSFSIDQFEVTVEAYFVQNFPTD